MSVSYEIRERFFTTALSAENFQAQYAKQIMQRQLALLFVKQLCVVDNQSDVSINSLRIELDEKIIIQSSDGPIELNDEIQKAIRKIADAQQLVIDIAYDYVWRIADDHLSIGPFVMTEYLDECDDALFECLEYTMHNFADCSSDSSAGTLVAYEMRNSIIHRGIVEFSEVFHLPKFGVWRAPMTALMFEEIEIVEGSTERVRQICNKLMEVSQYDDFFLEDNMLTYAMNNALLETPEKLDGFVANVSELFSLLCPSNDDNIDNFGMEASFVDISLTGPNILNINIDRYGNLKIYTALSLSKEVE